ncbi:MAG: oligopeptide/dipeptide transporter, ATPase subunit [Thermomicrobiales bacterium]|nr:oligopeptide/dipeptide transporter, ATPase subunit [Thermomicrobiales bacterium]
MPGFEPDRAARDHFVVRDLGVGFRTPVGIVPVVSGISLEAAPGKILGVAGESGSGKTTAVLAAIGYQSPSAVRLDGESHLGNAAVFALSPAERRWLWARRISYVAQDAAGSLNPAFRIGTQLREVLEVNGGLTPKQARARARELLAAVRLPDSEAMLNRYPHQCSGGQLQRIAIAMAIACGPDVIVCDEPTTGLDVTTQAEVVQMLTELIRSERMAAIYISHDLALLGAVADELAIFYAGEIVEIGPTADVLREPRHPYTRALLDAIPSAKRRTAPAGLAGFPPGRVISGSCPFTPRCPWAIDICRANHPDLLPVGNGMRLARCHRAEELAAVLASSSVRAVDAEQRAEEAGPPLLDIHNLTCSYGRGAARVEAVREASLAIGTGEVVALVGESGSGKSTIGRAIVGLVPIESGEIRLASVPLDPAGRRTPEQARAIQIIFQNPDSSLNPRHTVGALIARSLELFRPDISRRDRPARVAEALAEVRLDPGMMDRYPHQLSGGQKQRVAIARAFTARPRLVICDEIVSGQDVSVQAAILELVRAMQQRYRTGLLFVSHDLAVVRSIAQRLYVIHRGQIVESGPTEQVFDRPQAGYSRALLESVLEPVTGVGVSA